MLILRVDPGEFLTQCCQPSFQQAGGLRRLLAQRPDRDIEGVFVDEHRAYLGAGYIRDTFTYEFADRTLAPHYRGIQKFLGDESCVAITDSPMVGHDRL